MRTLTKFNTICFSRTMFSMYINHNILLVPNHFFDEYFESHFCTSCIVAALSVWIAMVAFSGAVSSAMKMPASSARVEEGQLKILAEQFNSGYCCITNAAPIYVTGSPINPFTSKG